MVVLMTGTTKPSGIFGAKKSRRNFYQPPNARVEISTFQKFLDVRSGSDGKTLFSLVGPPTEMGHGEYRFPWLHFSSELFFSTEMLPETSAAGGKADWQRAWHGCKLEALLSIMYTGKLRASTSTTGDRIKKGVQAVYCHGDGEASQAWEYSRWVPLCGDGVFWCAVWELQIDRSERADRAYMRMDQLMQPEHTVKLVALWVRGLAHYDMEVGSQAQEVWNPLHEANPYPDPMRLPPMQLQQLRSRDRKWEAIIRATEKLRRTKEVLMARYGMQPRSPAQEAWNRACHSFVAVPSISIKKKIRFLLHLSAHL